MGRSIKMQAIADIRQLKERCRELEELIDQGIDVEINIQYLERLKEQIERLYDEL